MNARISELIKQPELLVADDIRIIERQIAATPYVQPLRALKLKAVHLFRQEDYEKNLSETAAYTTDKKILFQLINGKPAPQVALTAPSNVPGKYADIPVVEAPAEPKPVYVENQLNRILFEGEENFLNEETPQIDLEQTRESGKLSFVSLEKNTALPPEEKPAPDEKPATDNNIPLEETPTSENPVEKPETNLPPEEQPTTEERPATSDVPTEETPMPENPVEKPEPNLPPEEQPTADEKPATDKISTEEKASGKQDATERANESHDVNFYQSETFIPQTFSRPKAENYIPKPSQKQSKAEEEMQRLIAEVEAKMKSRKPKNIETPAEEIRSSEISFAETATFGVDAAPTEKAQNEFQPIPEETQRQTEWKPMNFSGNMPDSAIVIGEKPTVSEEKPPQETQTLTEPEKETDNSNVPGFINTWQNWLKISPSENIAKEQPVQAEPEIPSENKEKIIENFIEANPRISRLRDDASFAVREKTDDISHLMTETLANLYVEQRLYNKAINAYEILAKKFPERRKEFNAKISEIRGLKPGK